MYDVIRTERYANSTVRWILFDRNRIKIKLAYEKNGRVSDLVKKHKATFGFNFPFFYNGSLLGNAKDGENMISQAYGKMLKWHSFASKNGRLSIDTLDVKQDFDFLVQGAPLLVENGKACHTHYIKHQEVNPDIANTRCQRTAVGITERGDLLVVICDGRLATSPGLTLGELAQFLINKGAIWAMNGDGGGSTVLADQSGSLGMNKGVNERRVGHAMLVFNESLPKISGTATVIVDGKEISKGYIMDGRTYIPVRDVSENLGADVQWTQATSTVTIKSKK